MNYQETLDYLFEQLPMYQRLGQKAFKKDLTNIKALLSILGNPEKDFKSIHIAGTNGKGSTSHMLAAVFQNHGYKTGLYTSPHLLDFRERIRINGELISEGTVISFTEKIKPYLKKIKASFFEITVAMAFKAFSDQKIEVAIIETGLGGRLDSTNVLNPLLSLITNISLDHQKMLGDTREKIAFEKAGIIKPNTPVIIGEKDDETSEVFIKKAKDEKANLIFAEDRYSYGLLKTEERFTYWRLKGLDSGKNFNYKLDLPGLYQAQNLRLVIAALDELKEQFSFDKEITIDALSKVVQTTGLKGRWEVLTSEPTCILDVAHNKAALKMQEKQLANYTFDKLHIVFGMSNDKPVDEMVKILPDHAEYYFAKPDVPRGMEVGALLNIAHSQNKSANSFESVEAAVKTALKKAGKHDIILISGSAFVVAEALAYFELSSKS